MKIYRNYLCQCLYLNFKFMVGKLGFFFGPVRCHSDPVLCMCVYDWAKSDGGLVGEDVLSMIGIPRGCVTSVDS